MDQLFGGGTPQQNYGQNSANISNELNTAFNNNQQAVNNSLSWLLNFLGKNPSPVSTWGGITPPDMFGAGTTLGGGGTNSLGQLVNAPANANNSGAAPGGGIGGVPTRIDPTRYLRTPPPSATPPGAGVSVHAPGGGGSSTGPIYGNRVY